MIKSDYLKFLRQHSKLKPKVVSLSSNIETITAISNDINYDQIFKYQAENLFEKKETFCFIFFESLISLDVNILLINFLFLISFFMRLFLTISVPTPKMFRVILQSF